MASATGRRIETGLPSASLVVFVVALTVLRLVVAGTAGLVDDETYYRLWSENLQFGYLDHAPMVAWLIAAGRALAGEGPLGVRLAAAPMMAIGSFLLWRAVALIDGRRIADLAVVWFNATLLAGAGAIVMTPDTPAVFFWGATVWALAELAASGDRRWWLVVGVVAGLGLASKYSVLFLGLGIGVWLLATAETRRMLASPWLWAGGAIALATFAPVVAWNADHQWMSFAKQFGRTVPKEWRPEKVAEFVGVQILLIGPAMVPFVGLGLAATRAVGDAAGAAGRWLPIATSAPFLAYLLFHSLHGGIEGNWPAPLYPAIAWMAARGFAALDGAAGAWAARWRRLAPLVAPIGFGLTALLYLHAAIGLVILPANRDPTAQMRGWDGFAAQVDAVARGYGATWIAAANYTLYGQLAYRLGTERVVALDERERYGHLPPLDLERIAGKAILVTRAGRGTVELFRSRFGSITPLGVEARVERGVAIEEHELFLLADPIGPPPR